MGKTLLYLKGDYYNPDVDEYPIVYEDETSVCCKYPGGGLEVHSKAVLENSLSFLVANSDDEIDDIIRSWQLQQKEISIKEMECQLKNIETTYERLNRQKMCLETNLATERKRLI
jgi:hypothetical protein